MSEQPPIATAPKKTRRFSRLALFRSVIFLIIFTILGGVYFAGRNGLLEGTGLSYLAPSPTPTLTPSPLPPETSTPTPSETPSATPSQTPTPLDDLPLSRHDFPNGLIVLSLREGLYAHLFVYEPQTLPLTRITYGEWDDITPAISPDGTRLVFASNRTGHFNFFLIDLSSGEITQLTDTPEYKARPTWSPDGLFIAYESYANESLEIFLAPVDGSSGPIQLTDDPGADFAPAWSPRGRQIAFVSTRGGEPDIWLADLQNPDQRYTNVSDNPSALDQFPAWSPDGSVLAWAAIEQGVRTIRTRIFSESGAFDNLYQVRTGVGAGAQPIFSPDGNTLLTSFETPNETFLTAYQFPSTELVALPPVALPGALEGMAWGNAQIPRPAPDSLLDAIQVTPSPLWSLKLTPNADLPTGRQHLVPLVDVQVPDPRLHDIADESFAALRAFVAQSSGWDFLATLENAFVPLTSPLPPGMGNDWLYTGRAIAVNIAPINAGWLKVVREDFGQETYWRIYLLARFQDGSQGRPMTTQAWDLSARFDGQPAVYEQGGELEPAPPVGYWIDFTVIASSFGWERLPALGNWRGFYQGARFNEFVHRLGSDWYSAMLELYPPEVLITPTQITPVTPSLTPTRTPSPTITPRPSQTSSPTITPSPTRTLTPNPTIPPTATPTSGISPTP